MLSVLDLFLKFGFSRQFVDMFKRELRLLRIRLHSSLSLRQRRLLKKMKQQRGLKVNLACGSFTKSDWISVDASTASRAALYWDLQQRLPFPDRSCAYAFCEHFLEHLPYPDGVQRFIAECYRILEDGGTLRLVLPDAEKFINAYAGADTAFLEKAAPQAASSMEALNLIFHGEPLGEHYYAYDFHTLSDILTLAGFREILKAENGIGSIAAELDRTDESRILESLYIEAVK